jgi:hypothetical protein
MTCNQSSRYGEKPRHFGDVSGIRGLIRIGGYQPVKTPVNLVAVNSYVLYSLKSQCHRSYIFIWKGIVLASQFPNYTAIFFKYSFQFPLFISYLKYVLFLSDVLVMFIIPECTYNYCSKKCALFQDYFSPSMFHLCRLYVGVSPVFAFLHSIFDSAIVFPFQGSPFLHTSTFKHTAGKFQPRVFSLFI